MKKSTFKKDAKFVLVGKEKQVVSMGDFLTMESCTSEGMTSTHIEISNETLPYLLGKKILKPISEKKVSEENKKEEETNVKEEGKLFSPNTIHPLVKALQESIHQSLIQEKNRHNIIDRESNANMNTIGIQFVKDVLDKIANKKCFSNYNEGANFLNTLYAVNLGAFKSVVLQEIAVLLDSVYVKHITKANLHSYFIINRASMEVSTIDAKFIEKYGSKDIALFRTKQDADIALQMLTLYLNE